MKINPVFYNGDSALNMLLIAKIYRILSLRRRGGTAHTKTRSEVSGTGKKLYSQKGSGRARAGQKTSPIRRGGGVAFGPRYRNFKGVKYNKKEHRASLTCCLRYYAANNRCFSFSDLSAKTRDNASALASFRKENNLTGKLLIVGPDPSLYNIEHIRCIDISNLNTYDLINQSVVLVDERHLERFNAYLI